MKQIKATYERPSCDLLVVRFEQGLLTGSNPYNTERPNSVSSGYDDNNDLGTI